MSTPWKILVVLIAVVVAVNCIRLIRIENILSNWWHRR